MFKKLVDYSLSIFLGQWKGFFFGVISSLVASHLYTAETSYTESMTYRRSALHELTTRLELADQSILMTKPLPGSAINALKIIEKLYNDTKSQTGNPRFEGQRLENIIFNLQQNSDKPTSDLLDRIKYANSDVFFVDKDTKKSVNNEPGVAKLFQKISDYRCCLPSKENEDKLGCSAEYFTGPHYCIFINNKLYMPPERALIKSVSDDVFIIVPEKI